MVNQTTPQQPHSGGSHPSRAPARTIRWVLLATVVVCVLGIGAWVSGRDGPPQAYFAQVVNEYPHDANAYSQGLIFVDGSL